MNPLRGLVIVVYFSLATLPLAWLALTSIKTYDDTISARAKFIPWADNSSTADAAGESARFAPTLDAYRNLSRPVAGTTNDFYHYLGNSVIIGVQIGRAHV